MNGLALSARRALVDLVARLAGGGGIAPADRAWVDAELPLSGFRKTVRGYLLRRMARAGLANGDVTIQCRTLGAFTLACSATDFGVGWEVLEKGTYEPHIVAFYKRTIRPGMEIADIGANIGFHALHAAALAGPQGRVLAVEPDPGNASLLRLSLALNQRDGRPLAPVEVVEAALSDANGEVVQTDLGNAGNSGARFTHHDRARLERLVHGVSPSFRTVRAIRWDDLHSEAPIALVKIDIEGFEPYAMRGMERSLVRHRPIVLSEFAPSNLASLGGIRPEEYLDWFAARGYRCAVLQADGTEAPAGDPPSVMRRASGTHHVDVVFRPSL